MDVTLVFVLATTLIFLVLALKRKALYVNLGKLGGYRVQPGRLEKTRMKDTKGLALLNVGNLSRPRRARPNKRSRTSGRSRR